MNVRRSQGRSGFTVLAPVAAPRTTVATEENCMADYKLTPASVPLRGGGGRPPIYVAMLADFAAMKEASVEVEYARKPDTVYNGLAAALRKHPEFKGISVMRRGEKVFLTRKK